MSFLIMKGSKAGNGALDIYFLFIFEMVYNWHLKRLFDRLSIAETVMAEASNARRELNLLQMKKSSLSKHLSTFASEREGQTSMLKVDLCKSEASSDWNELIEN